MKIAFFGSSRFSLPSLEALLKSGCHILCVITQPDRKKGRGLEFCATPVKLLAQQAGLNIFQPEDINCQSSFDLLKKLECELFVIVAYGKILSSRILELAGVMSLNAHASLLPKYRGASPINRAIINGDKVTGVTVIKMAPRMDAGPVILQKKIEISDSDDALTLEDKLSGLSAKALLEAIEGICAGKIRLFQQDESRATYAPKLKKEDGLIDWAHDAESINNLVRGCKAWPGAYTFWQGKMLKIHRARVTDNTEKLAPELPAGRQGKAGKVIGFSNGGILVATGKGYLVIQDLQLEGKRSMSAEEFIAGHKIGDDSQFGKK